MRCDLEEKPSVWFQDITLGGFSRSLTDYSIRIDYVQHNISGLIALYKIMLK